MKRIFLVLIFFQIGFVSFGQEQSDTLVSTIKDTLRVGIYNSPPFVYFNENGNIEGLGAWLWDRVNGELNHPFKIVKYESDHPLEDILKGLENGEIDFTFNPITITSERHKFIDFTVPFYVGQLTIAKRSETNYETALEFLKIFLNKRILYLTLILIISIFSFGLMIWLIEKRNMHFERGWRGLLSSLWWSAVTMTTVGYGDKVPISNLGRFVAFMWMLFSLVMIGLFTATITSNLTVKKLTNEDLKLENFRQSKVGTVNTSATEYYLKRNFFSNLKSYSQLSSGLDALNSEEIDYFAYDQPWLLYQINNNPKYADLEIMPIHFDLQLYGMAMKHGLDLKMKNRISEKILFLMEGQEWQMLLENYDLKNY